jgi:hypothetical protein
MWVCFEQRELLIRAGAYLGWQTAVIIPEIRVRPMDHGAALERLCSSGSVIGQGAIDTVIDAAPFKIGFKLRVDTLRVVLIKPLIQFFHLLGRERLYCAFDVLHGA